MFPEATGSSGSQKKLIIYAGTNDAVKCTSKDISNKLLQLKSFIHEKLPDAEIISTPAIFCHFLIQNYLAHTKKDATKKSLSQKNILSK